MNLLFICSQNRLRSPTAESIFSGVAGVEVSSAGVNRDAEVPVSSDLLEWADVIICMERYHHNKIKYRFAKALRGKRVVCLGIPDDYEYMASELIRLLWDRVPRSVPMLVAHRPTEA